MYKTNCIAFSTSFLATTIFFISAAFSSLLDIKQYDELLIDMINTNNQHFQFNSPQEEINPIIRSFSLDKLDILTRNNSSQFLYKEFLYYREFDQSRQSLVYVGNDFKSNNVIRAYIHATLYEGLDIYIINNAYIHSWHDIFTQDYIFDFYEDPGMFQPNELKKKVCNSNSGYKYVLAPLVRWLPIFGHWVTDTVCPLLYVEDWIWDLKPVLALPMVYHDYAREYLNILGHSDIKIVNREREFIYGEVMFVVKGFAHEISTGFHSFPILRDKMVQYYGLQDIKPEIYVYMNKPNLNRRFTNLKELISKIEEENNVKFTELRPNYPDRTTFARHLANAKLLICPGGSIAVNVVFMKENTGFLTLDSMNMEGPNLQYACNLNLWHVEVIHPKMEHFSRPGPANITRGAYAFKVLNYAVNNQKWPQNNLFSPYKLELFKELLKDGINFTLQMDHIVPELYEEYKKTVDFDKI